MCHVFGTWISVSSCFWTARTTGAGQCPSRLQPHPGKEIEITVAFAVPHPRPFAAHEIDGVATVIGNYVLLKELHRFGRTQALTCRRGGFHCHLASPFRFLARWTTGVAPWIWKLLVTPGPASWFACSLVFPRKRSVRVAAGFGGTTFRTGPRNPARSASRPPASCKSPAVKNAADAHR